jgi:hypothetical protein
MWRESDAPATAKATYDTLIARTKGESRPWEEVVAELPEFMDASSKWEKHSWFIKHGFGENELGFLQEISLPDCRVDAQSCPGPYAFQRLIESWRSIVRAGFRPSADLVMLRRLSTFLIVNGVQGPTATTFIPIPAAYTRVFREFVAGLLAESVSVKNDLIDHALSRVAVARAARLNDSCPKVIDALRDLMISPDVMSGRIAPQPIEICIAAHEASLAGSMQISCEAASNAIRKIRPNRNGPSIGEVLSSGRGIAPLCFWICRF